MSFIVNETHNSTQTFYFARNSPSKQSFSKFTQFMFLRLNVKLISGIIRPSNNTDKVRHEGGDGTLHDGIVTNNNVFVDRLAHVILVNG